MTTEMTVNLGIRITAEQFDEMHQHKRAIFIDEGKYDYPPEWFREVPPAPVSWRYTGNERT